MTASNLALKRPGRRTVPETLRAAANAPPESRLSVVYTASQIQQRVSEIAERINCDYRNKTLHLMGLLDNSFMFIADLTRQLRVPLVCHFLHVTTKDRTWHGLPLREITYGPKAALAGKHVLLVDGVLQTGISLDFVIHSIQDQEPASLRTAALIVKTSARKVGVSPDYAGFRSPCKFFVGYGMGYEGENMNLPYIAEMRRGD
ncbi:MAG: phosphoribosyltransferase [Terriglobia bacterium]